MKILSRWLCLAICMCMEVELVKEPVSKFDILQSINSPSQSIVRESLLSLGRSLKHSIFLQDTIDGIFHRGCLPRLLELTTCQDYESAFLAVKVLSYLMAGSREQVEAILHDGKVLDLFKRNLTHPDYRVRVDAIRALGNASSSVAELRDHMLETRLLDHLSLLITNPANLQDHKLIQNSIKMVSNIYRKNLRISFGQVEMFLAALCTTIISLDGNKKFKLHKFASEAVSLIRMVCQSYEQLVIGGVIPALYALIRSCTREVLKLLGDLVLQNDDYAAVICQTGGLEVLKKVLQSGIDQELISETAWILGNISSTSIEASQSIVTAGLFPYLISFLSAPIKIAYEAGWVVKNIVQLCQHEQSLAGHLINMNVLDGLFAYLRTSTTSPKIASDQGDLDAAIISCILLLLHCEKEAVLSYLKHSALELDSLLNGYARSSHPRTAQLSQLLLQNI